MSLQPLASGYLSIPIAEGLTPLARQIMRGGCLDAQGLRFLVERIHESGESGFYECIFRGHGHSHRANLLGGDDGPMVGEVLTKREAFAAMAMQAILSRRQIKSDDVGGLS